MTVSRLRHIFFVAAVLCCRTGLYSQDKQVVTDNEQDKKYTPNASSIFNNLNKAKESGSSSTTIKNLVKFCPTMILRQKVMFYYERQLMDNFTINFGVGKAFGDDFLQRSFFVSKELSDDGNKLSSYVLLSNSKFDKSTPYLYGGARIYFSSTTFDEGFIEVAYRNENLEYLLNTEVNGYRVDGSNRAKFKMNAFSFGYGFIEMVGPKNNFCHELYINFGIKYFRYTQFDKVPTSVVNSQYVYQKTNLEQKVRVLPAINVGYCFGFGF